MLERMQTPHIPAWGERPGPLLPSLLRSRLANDLAPAGIIAWLGRSATCAELDSYVWTVTARHLDPSNLRELADFVHPHLEQLADIRPLPPVERLGELSLGFPLRTRTANALQREGLHRPEQRLQTWTIGQLLAIPSFGVVSLLDLLCVVEAMCTAATVAFTLPEAGGKRPARDDLPSWGGDGAPLVPRLLRAAVGDELAPEPVGEWVGREVALNELGTSDWVSRFGSPPVSVLRALADSLSPAVDLVASRRPFTDSQPVGPILRQLPLRTRTWNALENAGLFDPAGGLEHLTVRELVALHGFGIVSLVDLLSTAEAGLPLLGGQPQDAQAITSKDLQVLAAWCVGEHAATTVDEALSLLDAERPAEVEAVWQRLRRLDLAPIASELAAVYSPGHVIDGFLDQLDDRELEVLSERLLATDSPPTLDELGRRHSVSRERVRQIENRVKHRLEDLPETPAGRLAATTARTLGAAVPCQDATLGDLIAPLGPDANRLAAPLLLYLAGPYRVSDGWLINQRSASKLAETQHDLLHACDTNGILHHGDAALVLTEAGIHDQWHTRWIRKLRCFRDHGPDYLRWDGNTLDRLERLLRLASEPLTAEELLAMAGESLSARSIRQRMIGDPRFVRINKQSQFALPDWDYDEYTGVTDEIAQEVERCGGVADTEHLVRYVSSTYGVAETSVRAYLNASMFVRSETGAIRIRSGNDESVEFDRDLSVAPDACQGAEGWAIRIGVDADVLRGSGRAISPAFSAYVGVAPGEKLTFPATAAHVTISWPLSSITGPSIGSVRAEVLRLNADVGDLLFLTFDEAHGSFTARVVTSEELAGATGAVRLALLHGITPADDEPETMQRLAYALGLEVATDKDCARMVEAALTRRRQDQWLQFVPAHGEESVNDVLARLTRALSS